jgi:hypothetical protein
MSTIAIEIATEIATEIPPQLRRRARVGQPPRASEVLP